MKVVIKLQSPKVFEAYYIHVQNIPEGLYKGIGALPFLLHHIYTERLGKRKI